MLKFSPKLAYLLFFLSGVAGLIYEIIWGREFVFIFGSTTNSIVAVVSAFLGGLAIGSLVSGKVADKLDNHKLIKLYSLLELSVGLTAALTLILIPGIKNVYLNFSDGTSVTAGLLFIKFLLASLVILVPTTLMGATLPVLVRFLERQTNLPAKTVSLLYAVNTFGGVLGVALAAYVFIELFGLTTSLRIGVFINLTIAYLAHSIKVTPTKSAPEEKQAHEISYLKLINFDRGLVIFAFFGSGLISIAYQVLWTRVLTPVLGTVIYAFASILVIYLVGIALGSLFYQRLSKIFKNNFQFFAFLELGIGLVAFSTVILMHKFQIDYYWNALAQILPATILMGLTFPAVVSLIQDRQSLGKLIGMAYFSNTIGAIFGGYLTSFVLIPVLGSSASIAFLAFFNLLIAFVLFLRAKSTLNFKFMTLALVFLLLVGVGWTVLFKRDRLLPFAQDFLIAEAKMKGTKYLFKEDEIASVYGFRNDQEDQEGLLIDGVATTQRVAETKLMAHIPLALNPEAKRSLIIAFGMGTTFKSSLFRGLQTDVVDLVPSVPKNMGLFHKDAASVQTNSLGHIYINDGRNFAFLTRNKYDIVIIDPPPPFNTAGSTVLHSKEFYQALSQKLNPGGIVNQWIYYYRSREDEISMAMRSFVDVFPYVLAVQKNGNVGGIYMLGSYSPIDQTKLDSLVTNNFVTKDLQEFLGPDFKPKTTAELIDVIGDRDSVLRVVGSYPPITDDHPRSEYYLLRHSFSQSPPLENLNISIFLSKFK